MQTQDIFSSYSEIFRKIDWSKPESLILFSQAIYRIFALASKDWFVLHGSGVMVNDGAIVFGDDGKSVGKTTCALEVASHGFPLVADEFCLYKDGLIFPNSKYPLHFKSSSKDFVIDKIGEWKEWVEWDNFADSPVPLRAIVCPVYNPGTNRIVKLKGVRAKEALKCTAYAHVIKLKNPQMDRYNIFTGTNQNKDIKNIRGVVHEFSDFPDEIPIYEMQYRGSEYVMGMLDSAGLMKERPIKRHVSAGGVLLDKERKRIYLIYKEDRDEWLLPKGHVREGESITETALREIYEETGYPNIELLDEEPVGVVEYQFETPEEPEFLQEKRVYYYPAQLQNDEHKENTQEESEHLSGKWIALEEASTDKEDANRIIQDTIKKFC